MGNALTRALKEEHGDTLRSFLNKEDFWNSKTRRAQGREGDGIGVVQSASDQGRLLELAAGLAGLGKSSLRQFADAGQTTYPQNVIDVSRALLRWHSAILELFPPSTPLPLSPPKSRPASAS
jgi:hypothetical protein